MKDILEKMDITFLLYTEPRLMESQKILESLRKTHRLALIDSSMLIQRSAEQYNVVLPSLMKTGMSDHLHADVDDLIPEKRSPTDKPLIS